jgi:methionine-rich copper-binding protein CopC
MRVALIPAVMAMGLISSIPSASAHSMLVKAEPPRRAVLAKAPAHVRLWFNEEIEGDYASLVVLDPEKHPVTEAKPQLAQDDPQIYRASAARTRGWKVFGQIPRVVGGWARGGVVI